MYTNKQLVAALLAFQVIVIAVAQSTTVASNSAFEPGNVTTRTDDYILENRRQFNATLQGYLDKMSTVTNGLELGLKVLNRQKVLLLKTIQETYEKIDPLELLGLPAKYCVQQYRNELPYEQIVKTNIESCITSARNYASSIISSANTYYNYLKNYYTTTFTPNLNACAKSNSNPSLNYTLCVTSVISTVNSYVHTNRENFEAGLQSAYCSLENRLDVAASCTYTQLNSVLTSVGAATRLIHDCFSDYLESLNDNNNGTISAGCPNVVYVEVKDKDVQSRTINNPLLGLNTTANCVEIRFV
ncbi:uncharacterized protein LOC126762742 [Bactrocera neohumeralis]|uniref:uncharacterized protein LOC126762742 n=1 Tax=Bactrocera neohumeralis TaxID=98809 RepID=UPI002165713A|nr:uncharacterized protein LOC126762742 [Bactrocera neohumeralis]